MVANFSNDDAPDVTPSHSSFSHEKFSKYAEVLQFVETLQEFEVELEDSLLQDIKKISDKTSFQKARAISDQNAYLTTQELNINWRHKLLESETQYIDLKFKFIRQKKEMLKQVETNFLLEGENKIMRAKLEELGYQIGYTDESEEETEPEPENTPD